MEKFLEQLKKGKAKIALGAERKAALRSRLLQFLRADMAVREGQTDRQLVQRSPNTVTKPMPVFAVIAIMALLGGGTSLAAQNALPGDALYGMKVGVNEKVAAALRFGVEAKANYEAELASRRLDEAAKLAAEARVDANAKAELETRFAEHVKDVEAHLADLGANGNGRAAADVASRFEAALKAHQAILAKLEVKDKDVEAIEAKASTTAHVVSGLRVKFESDAEREGNEANTDDEKATVKAAAEGKIGAAENVLASAQSFFDKRSAGTSTQAAVEAKAQLNVAADLVAQAKVKLAAGAYGDAFVLANRAIRVAQQTRRLLEGSDEFDLDVRVGGNASSEIEREEREERGEIEFRATSTATSTGVRGRGDVELKVNF